MVQLLWKMVWHFLKLLNIELQITQPFHSYVCTQKK